MTNVRRSIKPQFQILRRASKIRPGQRREKAMFSRSSVRLLMAGISTGMLNVTVVFLLNVCAEAVPAQRMATVAIPNAHTNARPTRFDNSRSNIRGS